LTHGFANGIALAFRDGEAPSTPEDLVATQYSGAKAALRPVYERLVAVAATLGPRSKQFALIEAPSAKRVQLGLQLPDEPTTDRLLAGNAMCSHKVFLSTVDDVDDEILRWLRKAYERN
jgi:hypothetical protein